MVSRHVPRCDLFDRARGDDYWLIVETPWHKILEATKLAPDANLLRVFLVTLLRYHDDGWELSEFSARSATFYATKPEEKRYVYITWIDPNAAPPVNRNNGYMALIPKTWA